MNIILLMFCQALMTVVVSMGVFYTLDRINRIRYARKWKAYKKSRAEMQGAFTFPECQDTIINKDLH